MSESKYDSWIVVAECNTEADASIIAGAIENEGIPTQIMNKALQGALPMTYTWAPVQIMVPQSMADDARQFVTSDASV